MVFHPLCCWNQVTYDFCPSGGGASGAHDNLRAVGKEWLDPTKIPVEEIAEEWRTQSKRGRYEAAMWRAAGLEEPTAAKAGRGERGGEGAEAEVSTMPLTAASLGAMGASLLGRAPQSSRRRVRRRRAPGW